MNFPIKSTEKINIRVPPDLKEELKMDAYKAGVSLSAYLVAIIKEWKSMKKIVPVILFLLIGCGKPQIDVPITIVAPSPTPEVTTTTTASTSPIVVTPTPTPVAFQCNLLPAETYGNTHFVDCGGTTVDIDAIFSGYPNAHIYVHSITNGPSVCITGANYLNGNIIFAQTKCATSLGSGWL